MTLLVERHEEHPACKSCDEVLDCWCAYLSGARCRLFAYGPADATAIPNPVISCLIVLEKRPLNGYSSSSSSSSSSSVWCLLFLAVFSTVMAFVAYDDYFLLPE